MQWICGDRSIWSVAPKLCFRCRSVGANAPVYIVRRIGDYAATTECVYNQHTNTQMKAGSSSSSIVEKKSVKRRHWASLLVVVVARRRKHTYSYTTTYYTLTYSFTHSLTYCAPNKNRYFLSCCGILCKLYSIILFFIFAIDTRSTHFSDWIVRLIANKTNCKYFACDKEISISFRSIIAGFWWINFFSFHSLSLGCAVLCALIVMYMGGSFFFRSLSSIQYMCASIIKRSSSSAM